MTDAIHEQAARVRVWYNLVADAFAHRYDDRSGWYFERCEEDLLHAVVPLADRRILDLGTGSGRLLPRLAKQARSVTGVDISESLLRRTPRVAGAAIAQMDALDLGFQPESFDTVVSLGLFEYVSDLGPFLHEIRRVLRPGGQLAFTYHQAMSYRRMKDEAPETKYFGRTVAERTQYWSKARHRRGDVEAALGRHGFSLARRYRVFFRAPQYLYARSCRLTPGSAGDRLLRAGVVASDRLLGRALRPITQFWTGNVLTVAQKRT
jgi:2-polyprenyl-3-methyl-5-hydroxy-6-metoxy-1,4-benzoquinol methylase